MVIKQEYLNTLLLNEVRYGYCVDPRKSYEKIKDFLEMGADVNCKDFYGDTPLILFAKSYFGYGLNILDLLLSHGANVFQTGSKGKTAFKICQYNDFTLVITDIVIDKILKKMEGKSSKE